MSNLYQKQYTEEKEERRPFVFQTLFLKYLHNRENFRIESINDEEIIFSLKGSYYYFDIENFRATTKTDVRYLSKDVKQYMELLAEELQSPMYTGWEIARARKAKDRFHEAMLITNSQPDLLPESTIEPVKITWDQKLAHSAKEEYQKQSTVNKLKSVSLTDTQLLSFTSTRVRFLVGDSVLNFLPSGHYDPEVKQRNLLPARLFDCFRSLSGDIIKACETGKERRKTQKAQRKSIDKFFGPQNNMIFK